MSPRPVLMTAGAVVIALTGTLGLAALRGGSATTPAPQVPASAGGSHPGLDQLSSSCLDSNAVLLSWGGEAVSEYAGIGQDDNGKGCSQEMDAILPTHPVAMASVAAATRTVYIGKAPEGVLTGFFALTATESAAAAKQNGRDRPSAGPYYLVVSIPDDNAQAVLISILEQYRLPN